MSTRGVWASLLADPLRPGRRSTAKRLALALVVTLGCLAGPAWAASPAWAPWLAPEAMSRLEPAMVSHEVSSFCSDNCRYDRHGVGSEPPAANPYPDRWLYRDAGEVVLFDDPGAGVVTRLWLTSGGPTATCLDETLRVRLYFGEATQPLLDLPLARLFDGSTLPFTAPLVFDRTSGSGGYTSYVPIAFRQGLRIALTGLDLDGPCSLATAPSPPRLWYQIDAQRLPPGSVTSDFSVADAFLQLREFLAATGEDPWSRGLGMQTSSFSLAPGEAHVIAQPGGGTLAGLRIDADPAAWANVQLEIEADGEPVLALPLTAAFGVEAAQALPMRSPLQGRDAGNRLYSWWPMPFRGDLLIRLRNLSAGTTGPMRVDWSIDPGTPAAGAARHFALEHAACSTGGPTHEHRLLALSGSGRLMALGGHFSAHGAGDPHYLEGDTRIRFDGMLAPAWPGTGLEDFYNGGFYFNWGQPYRQPWSGASLVDPQGVSAMWRLLLADAPNFADGIEVLQEAGASPAEPLDVCMATVARGYASDQRALVPVARLEVGDPWAVVRHAWTPPAGADCSRLDGRFSDAAGTPRSALVCRAGAGASQFRMDLPEPAANLRLRRIADAAAGGQAARIIINGQPAGSFPPLRPDTLRRWQEQDAPLAVAAGTTRLEIRIEPLWGNHGDAGEFSESAYALWATPGMVIFRAGFEAPTD